MDFGIWRVFKKLGQVCSKRPLFSPDRNRQIVGPPRGALLSKFKGDSLPVGRYRLDQCFSSFLDHDSKTYIKYQDSVPTQCMFYEIKLNTYVTLDIFYSILFLCCFKKILAKIHEVDSVTHYQISRCVPPNFYPICVLCQTHTLLKYTTSSFQEHLSHLTLMLKCLHFLEHFAVFHITAHVILPLYSKHFSIFSLYLPFLHQAHSCWLRLHAEVNTPSLQSIVTCFHTLLRILGFSLSQPYHAVL